MLESIDTGPLNAATLADIVDEEVTTKAPSASSNTPGNVTKKRERGVRNEEEGRRKEEEQDK